MVSFSGENESCGRRWFPGLRTVVGVWVVECWNASGVLSLCCEGGGGVGTLKVWKEPLKRPVEVLGGVVEDARGGLVEKKWKKGAMGEEEVWLGVSGCGVFDISRRKFVSCWWSVLRKLKGSVSPSC